MSNGENLQETPKAPTPVESLSSNTSSDRPTKQGRFRYIVAGVILCLVFKLGIDTAYMLTRSCGKITNADYSLIHIANARGDTPYVRCELRKGESKGFYYGDYIVTIPDINAQFVLFKNSPESCTLRSMNGVLVVVTDGFIRINSEEKQGQSERRLEADPLNISQSKCAYK